MPGPVGPPTHQPRTRPATSIRRRMPSTHRSMDQRCADVRRNFLNAIPCFILTPHAAHRRQHWSPRATTAAGDQSTANPTQHQASTTPMRTPTWALYYGIPSQSTGRGHPDASHDPPGRLSQRQASVMQGAPPASVSSPHPRFPAPGIGVPSTCTPPRNSALSLLGYQESHLPSLNVQSWSGLNTRVGHAWPQSVPCAFEAVPCFCRDSSQAAGAPRRRRTGNRPEYLCSCIRTTELRATGGGACSCRPVRW